MSRRHSQILLVRHAKAEKGSPGGDAERRLTAEGREHFGRLLSELRGSLRITRILTSPLVRARQTADLLAAATGAPIAEDPRLSSGSSDGRALLALARRAGDGTALVGHNPELAEAVALAGGKEEEMPPGAVAAVELLQGAEAIAWLRRPPRGS